MCTRTDHDGACEDCQSTDEWVVPADLRRPAPASMERGGETGEKGAENKGSVGE